MRQSRWAVVLLLLLAAAAAQTANEVPPPDEGTDVQRSNCFQCHAEGGGRLGPSLQQMLSLRVEGPESVAINEPIPFQFTVTNEWRAILQDMRVTVRLGNDSALSMDARPEPLLDVRDEVTLAAPSVGALGEPREGVMYFRIPAGITEAKTVFRPNITSGDEAPAPQLVLVDPLGREASRMQLSPGESVRFPWTGATLPGEWELFVQLPAFTEGLPAVDRSRLAEQTFSIETDAWFNVTSESREFVIGLDGTIDGLDLGGDQTLREAFEVFLVEPRNATFSVRADATAFHDHPDNAARYDAWPFVAQVQVHVAPDVPVAAPSNGTTPAAKPERADLAGWGEAIGYWAAFSALASIVLGGMLGAGSVRLLHRWIGRKRRVLFHNVLGYVVILAATAHVVLFVVEPVYHWSIGLLLGGIATLALYALGVTGALQAPIIRATSQRSWQWMHWGSAWLLLVALAAHMLLDGAHYSHVAEGVGWRDPLAEALGAPLSLE